MLRPRQNIDNQNFFEHHCCCCSQPLRAERAGAGSGSAVPPSLTQSDALTREAVPEGSGGAAADGQQPKGVMSLFAGLWRGERLATHSSDLIGNSQ